MKHNYHLHTYILLPSPLTHNCISTFFLLLIVWCFSSSTANYSLGKLYFVLHYHFFFYAMGNCFQALKRSIVGIAPSDLVKTSPVVRLYGSPNSVTTSYIRFALMCKPVSLQFIPSNTPNFGSESPVIQCDSDVVTGSLTTMLHYLDAKFPDPPLLTNQTQYDGTTPLVVSVAILQHKSIKWHLERLVRWANDLCIRGGKSRGDPAMGSSRMEVKKFGQSYSQLFEVMLEHAQMEEKIIFPILENADRGLCKAANEEHARDLPIMNGIKEDIKAIGVLDSATPDLEEALFNLSSRLKILQEHCKTHFEEEERKLLPLMEGAEASKEEGVRLLDECLDAMQAAHSHLFCFLIEGFVPHEAMRYLDLIIKSSSNQKAKPFAMLLTILRSDRN